MAAITFNFTAAQSARVQAATDAYNLSQGTALTPKQFIMWIIRENVRERIVAADTTPKTLTAAIIADMGGDA